MPFHVDDVAELYALGSLEDREREAVDVHLRRCSQCTQAIADAERDVATIASMEPRHEAPAELGSRIERVLEVRPFARAPRAVAHTWMIPAAMAAVLLLGLLPTAYFAAESRAMHDAMIAQNSAITRLASQPYRVANFNAARARVVYGVDGSWYVVIVPSAPKKLAVAWMHDGGRTMLGEAVPHGDVATLYLPKSHRMDRLALMDGERIVAEAKLTWQRTAPNRQAVRSV